VWVKIKTYVQRVIPWSFVTGLLVLMHIVDSKAFEVPDTIVQFTNEIPRVWYPILYGVLCIFALGPLQSKISQEPLKKARVLFVLFFIILLAVVFFDLPNAGGLNTQYVGIFLLTILGLQSLVFLSRVIEIRSLQQRETSDADLIEAKVIDDRLRTDLSWLWAQNNDSRNAELVRPLKSAMLVIIPIVLGSAILVFLLQLRLPELSDEDLLRNTIIATVIVWGIMFYGLAKVNKKYWAPNIDADKKLRKALGSQYDTELDRQLETKSLKNLLDENWFIHEYSQVTDAKPHS